MKRDWKDLVELVQKTRPKGRDAKGDPHEPVEIPVPTKEEIRRALEKIAKGKS